MDTLKGYGSGSSSSSSSSEDEEETQKKEEEQRKNTKDKEEDKLDNKTEKKKEEEKDSRNKEEMNLHLKPGGSGVVAKKLEVPTKNQPFVSVLFGSSSTQLGGKLIN